MGEIETIDPDSVLEYKLVKKTNVFTLNFLLIILNSFFINKISFDFIALGGKT